MGTIELFLDGKVVQANEGATILEVARANGVYIPTMCYLTKVSPIASCRVCVVEVEGVEGTVLACGTRVTPGINITTNSDMLQEERRKIYELYAVNHPLECGVCDKSGACDLQNGMLEFKVDCQHFAAKEQPRAIQDWGLINYDPNLCILCERCVHVCNETIGDDAIEIRYGGYNSIIIPKNSETLDCTYCGECIAVCPVGALVSNDFKYVSNAWELQKVPSTCVHCSAGCALNYEVKRNKIYRVTNDYEFTTLCGAGRFGFDHAVVSSQNERQFSEALNAFSRADTIAFSSIITNEEAYILQKLKETHGYRLYNPQAHYYQKALLSYSRITGKSLYSATSSTLKHSEAIIVLGSAIKTDNPAIRYALTHASKKHRADIVYMHPIEDEDLKSIVTQFVKYEVGTEEGVIALLCAAFINEPIEGLSDIDWGYISGETSIGEEEIQIIKNRISTKKSRTLVIGEDCITHPRSEEIAKMAGLLEMYAGFEILLLPRDINTLGVALICDLDDSCGQTVIGYNANGHYTLLSNNDLKENALSMPAFNQQEGTITSLDKRVVVINPAVEYKGYELVDLAHQMGINYHHASDCTIFLPTTKGFKKIPFYNLSNHYSDLGEDCRGYLLDTLDVQKSDAISLSEIDELPEFNGLVVYECNPVLHFNMYTAMSQQLEQDSFLRGSKQFATAAKVVDGDIVRIQANNKSIQKVFKVDTSLKGSVALFPSFDTKLSENVLSSEYRFTKVFVEKVITNG